MKTEEVTAAAAHGINTRTGMPKRVGRRQFTELEKRSYVMQLATKPPEQTLKAFCRQEDLVESALKKWSEDPRFKYTPDKSTAAMVRSSPKTVAAVAVNQPEMNGRFYPEDVKFKVAAAHANKEKTGQSVKAIAKEFGVREPMVYAWAKDPRYAAPDPHKVIAEHQELSRAKRPKRATAPTEQPLETRIMKKQIEVLGGMVELAMMKGFSIFDHELGGKQP